VVRVLSRLHALAQANPASSAAVKELQLLVRTTAERPCMHKQGELLTFLCR
jgi:hypothetical protein